MNILVTGGAGCIGCKLVERLLKENNSVMAYDNLSSGKIENIKHFEENKNFKFLEADLLDFTKLKKSMKDINFVFHLAANPDIKFLDGDPTNKDLNQNTIATYNVLESMRVNNVKKIAFSSSSAIYGKAIIMPTTEKYPPQPTSLYGASKVACEALISGFCYMFNIQSWIFRFANVVGRETRKKGRTVISDFIFKLRENTKNLEVLGDGKQTKSYILVDDCIDGMLFTIKNSNKTVNTFNLSTKDSIDVDKIAQIVIGEMGLKSVKISYTGGVGGWRGDITNFLLDTTKLKKLGWSSKYNSEEAVRISTQRILGIVH